MRILLSSSSSAEGVAQNFIRCRIPFVCVRSLVYLFAVDLSVLFVLSHFLEKCNSVGRVIMMLLWWGVLGCATAWTTLYYIIKHVLKLESEWACRLLTACHATVVTTLGGLSCYYGPWPFTEPGGPNTSMQVTTLTICLGYFLFDFIWCIYHQTEGLTMLIHHAVSIFAIGRILMKGVSGTEAVAGVTGLEITNPFLQLRWFLRSLGYKDTLAFIIVEISFMLMFFFMRIIGGGYLFYSTVLHPRPDCEAKVLAGAFYVISWIFMIYISQYFYAKYCRKTHQLRAENKERECKKAA